MNNNSRYGGLHAEAKILIENHQTPLLCFYLDKESNEVKLIADTVSQRKVRESGQFEKLECLLKRTKKEKNKLAFYDDCSLGHGQCNPKDPMFSYDKLPTEILRAIFKYLVPEDLKTLILVSQTWKSVADEPLLWTGFGLPTKCMKNQKLFEKFFEGSLSSKLQYLELGKCDFLLEDHHFEMFMSLNIFSIKITCDVDLSKVSNQLLLKNDAEVKIKIDDITIFGIEGLESILHSLTVFSINGFDGLRDGLLRQWMEILDKSCKLKCLELFYIDVTQIPKQMLARVANKIERVNLIFAECSPDQLKEVFKGMVKSDSKMKHLELTDSNLSLISPTLFAKAVNKLESFLYGLCELSESQVLEMFRIMSLGTNLKNLRIYYGDKENGITSLETMGMDKMEHIELVEPEILAKAVNNLESLQLDLGASTEESSRLTLTQILAIVKKLNSKTSLKCASTRARPT